MNSDIIVEIAGKLQSFDDLLAFAQITPLHAAVINEYKNGIARQILGNIGIQCPVFFALRHLEKTFESKKRMDLKHYDTSHVPPKNWFNTWLDLHSIKHNYYWALTEGRPDLAKVLYPVAKKKPRYLRHVAHVLGAIPGVNKEAFEFFFTRHKSYRYHILDLHLYDIQADSASYIFDYFIQHDMKTVNRVLYDVFIQPDSPQLFLLQVAMYVTDRGAKIDVDVLLTGLRVGMRNMHWDFVHYIGRCLSQIPEDVKDYYDTTEYFRDF